MENGSAIGVDLGGTKILAGVVDRDGNVLRRYEMATPTASEGELLAGVEAAVEAVHADGVVALGFGIPSTIDQRSGRAVSSVNIPLHDLDFRDRMRKRFGLPVGIDNDANAAAIGEWRVGAGRGTNDMVMLTIGTGLGGGLILGGKPYRGFMGAGAELGHMVIVHDGRPCQGTCTGRGHLEPYVTGVAATAAAREAFGPAADAHRLVRLAHEGDETAIGILAEIGRHLGSAFGTLVNVFNPELIVIGGGFGMSGGDLLIGPAREVMEREALRPGRDLVRIAHAELGTAAGLIGAAFVAFEAADAAA
ncbi:MAG TPA: ROK family protein [Gaiellaceae bacterium]|jgi:glucokinase